MSKLLQDLIRQSRADAQAYEQFLKDAEALVRRMADKGEGNHPDALNSHPSAIVLFNNLASLPSTSFQCPSDDDAKAALALELDRAMRERAPAGWKGDGTREKQVLNALFPLLNRDRAATRAIFDIIKQQPKLFMNEIIELGDISIHVTRKAIKHVHLSVHPPLGRVTLVAPSRTRLEVARAYAISKLGWIRDQQAKLRDQAREAPRRYVERETHHLWGRRYLMTLRYEDAKPSVTLDHRRITLTVRPGASAAAKAEIVHNWHKSLLHDVVPVMIGKWEPRLGVTVAGYFLQRVKTKWGSCNRRAGNIRLNTELAKKPKDLLEYVVVHELAHLLEPTHSGRFVSILDQNYPGWRDARAELNELPLSAESWIE